MKRVSQTTFGGPDAPRAEMGNCLQACVASILGIPLEEAFDSNDYATTEEQAKGDERQHWYLAFEDWCYKRGLGLFWLQGPISDALLGIADVHSKALGHGIRHAVVARGREVYWDPNPHYRNANVEHEFVEQSPCWMYIVPLDITEWTRMEAARDQ